MKSFLRNYVIGLMYILMYTMISFIIFAPLYSYIVFKHPAWLLLYLLWVPAIIGYCKETL